MIKKSTLLLVQPGKKAKDGEGDEVCETVFIDGCDNLDLNIKTLVSPSGLTQGDIFCKPDRIAENNFANQLHMKNYLE